MATAQPALDIPTLLATPIQFPLPESEVKLVLASAPFIPIPHALNLRTISSPNLQPNKVFRSGALSHLTPSILSALKDQYNITTIFDLRARNEREKQPSPDVEGIETIWIPNTEDAGTAPTPIYIPIEDFAVGGGVDAYLRRYENVLQMYGSVYKTIFEKLRDSDEGGVLFHCTGTYTLPFPRHHLPLVACPIQANSESMQLGKIAQVFLPPSFLLLQMQIQRTLRTITH
jgi:hypothetical protein